MSDLWIPQVRTRIAISEGCRLYKYRDSMGVVTLAIGLNMQRGNLQGMFEALGIDWDKVQAAPVAIDSLPQNAVAACITQAQADALFDHDLPSYIAAARASLDPGNFDALSDARRFVLCDLEYNLGQAGWMGFGATRGLINHAEASKRAGKMDLSHRLFGLTADHLRLSAWDGQVGSRARRDEAMMRSSLWCDPNGDGSDVAA